MSALVAVALVAAGSALGAVLRHLVDRATARAERAPAWGTGAVNVTGSFLLGALVGLARSGGVPDEVALTLGTGLLGSYTTFSTFVVQVVAPAGSPPGRAAAVTAVASVVLGLAAAWVGVALTHG